MTPEERLGLGSRVRAARKKKGLSQVLASQLAGHSDRYVLDLEAGRIDPRLGDLAGVAQVLEVTVESLVSQSGVKDVAAGGTLEPEGTEADRRRFLELFGTVAGIGLFDIERLASPVVDSAYVRDADALTAAFLAQWYGSTPSILLPPVLVHLNGLQRALPGSRALEHLAARTAVLAGHLYQKLDRLGVAWAHYALAEGLAGDDSNLLALVLVLRGALRKTTDRRFAMDLTNEAARVGMAAPPLLKTLLLARRAEERAAAGDETGSLLDMEAAERALEPSTEHWYGPRDAAELGAIRGSCEMLLGRHRDAADTLSWTLQRMHPSAVNWRARVALDRDTALSHLS